MPEIQPEGSRNIALLIDADNASPDTLDPVLTVLAELGAAWKAAKRDEQGFARLSEIGERAGNRSSFDVRNYGFSRLSELIEGLPNFVTERREDGATWVKRLR